MRFIAKVSLIGCVLTSMPLMAALPDPPVIGADKRLVTNIEGTGIQGTPGSEPGYFVRQFAPPLRTSVDGRIGLALKKRPMSVWSPTLNQWEGKNFLRIFLVTPENFLSNMVDPDNDKIRIVSKSPVGLVVDTNGAAVSNYDAGTVPLVQGEVLIEDINNDGSTHATLCQPHDAGQVSNPYRCLLNGAGQISADPAGSYDCYDLVAVTASRTLVNFSNASPAPTDHYMLRLRGQHFTVAVANPKSTNASVAAVEMGIVDDGMVAGSPKMGNFGGNEFFEPTITADGHQMVFRTQATHLIPVKDTGLDGVINEEDMSYCEISEKLNSPDYEKCGKPDVLYSYNQDAGTSCDVSKWQEAFPITHAYFDARLNPSASIGDAKYGFAEYQLRDSSGHFFADNEEMKITYPWIDKQGRNLFFTSVATTLYVPSGSGASRFGLQVKNIDGTTVTNKYVDSSATRGAGFAGLWSHGKIVVIDNSLNQTDFDLKVADADQRKLGLYNGVDVRVGSGRDTAMLNVPGWLWNASFIDSMENTSNYNKYVKPVTPRDVVWKMLGGTATDELVFDDYLDVNALVVSGMQAGVMSKPNGVYIPTLGQTLCHFDGSANWPNWSCDTALRSEALVQNAATTLKFDVPDYGQVIGGAVKRIEPVALGGVNGKGLWLADNSYLSYSMKDNTAKNITAWYVGIFVDSRFVAGERTLLNFPDGSRLTISELTELKYYQSGIASALHSVTVAVPSNSWMHIGLQMNEVNHTIKLYIDGYLKDEYGGTPNIFNVAQAGSLSVGASTGGFRGWIDDFKVFAEEINPEVACNHANGTLMGVDPISGAHFITDGSATTWQMIAADYPQSFHDAISLTLKNAGKKFYSQYVCYHNYTGDYKAHLGNVPNNRDYDVSHLNETAGIRDAMLMPEGPLYYDAPRPEFYALAGHQNDFCETCHNVNDTNVNNPLGLQALQFVPIQDGNGRGGNAKSDKRRQPMQPPRFVHGFVPNDWLKENFSGDETYVDEWVLTSKDADDDYDGISNACEINPVAGCSNIIIGKSDPQHKDTDSDGSSDGIDAYPMIPLNGRVDTDGDGRPNDCDATCLATGMAADDDDDSDGLTDAQEIIFGTDSLLSDTDGDSWNDLQEYQHHTNPLVGDASILIPQCDFNTDRTSDILMRGVTDNAWRRFTVQNGQVQSNAIFGIPALSDYQYAASLDADGDGDADVLTRKTSDYKWYLYNVNLGNVTGSIELTTLPNSSNWVLEVAADFNGDGAEDVLLRDTDTGEIVVYIMQNGVIGGSNFIGTLDSSDTIQAAGDMDHDGTDDILIRHSEGGANQWIGVKFVDGIASSLILISGLPSSADLVFQAIMDLNADGTNDIVMRHMPTTGGATGNWTAFPITNFTVGTTYSLPNLYVNPSIIALAGAADYNGDGAGDFILVNTTSGTYHVFLTNSATGMPNLGVGISLWSYTNGWRIQEP